MFAGPARAGAGRCAHDADSPPPADELPQPGESDAGDSQLDGVAHVSLAVLGWAAKRSHMYRLLYSAGQQSG